MRIRPLSIALIQNGPEIFVMECFDRVKNEEFYRPLGGGIEFGETGSIALKREFQEEMKTDLEHIEYLTTFENIFTFEGVKYHEIVLLFKADFVDKELYSTKEVICNEEGKEFISKWIDIEEFVDRKRILYPDELPAYLSQR